MNLDAALALLADDPAAPLDVAELALTLARDEYPFLDVESELAEVGGQDRLWPVIDLATFETFQEALRRR